MWSTESEVKFLKGLGTYSNILKGGEKTLKDLLAGYVRGLDRRKKWDNIDKGIIKNVALGMLDSLTDGGKGVKNGAR